MYVNNILKHHSKNSNIEVLLEFVISNIRISMLPLAQTKACDNIMCTFSLSAVKEIVWLD